MDKIIHAARHWHTQKLSVYSSITFCGITNRKKRKSRGGHIQTLQWLDSRINCPECLGSPAYRERMAVQMSTRMTETKFEKGTREYVNVWRRGSRRTGDIGPL